MDAEYVELDSFAYQKGTATPAASLSTLPSYTACDRIALPARRFGCEAGCCTETSELHFLVSHAFDNMAYIEASVRARVMITDTTPLKLHF